MDYILILFFLSFGIYILFLITNIFSLLFLPSRNKKESSNSSVSVIVAIRNGEKSLNTLIEDLLNQDYQGELEFILVDDQSIDLTKKIIQDAAKKHLQIKYVSSSDGDPDLSFKKRALDAGIKKSKYDTLLFTDVDCRLGKFWVFSMSSSFGDRIDYVIGFSRAKYQFGFANLFQKIDFLMLMFSAKAVSDMRFPLACSGQNQAFKKSLFKKVGGYKKISNLLMGDDSIFLQLCLKMKAKVVFCNNPQSYVFCRDEKSWKDLFLQRMRWAGDGNIMWKYNIIFYQIMLATVFSNILIFFLLSMWAIELLLIILIIKFTIELILNIVGSIKFNERFSLSNFVYWYTVNIPYVCIMCFASFFVPFISWKSRIQ